MDKRPRPWREVVKDVANGPSPEQTAGEAYKKVLLLLKEQRELYGERIWDHLNPEQTTLLRCERGRLLADIAIVEALLQRYMKA